MSNRHPTGRLFRLTILRVEGTAWIIEHCKHVLARDLVLEAYVGEHNVNRIRYGVPLARIDHYTIEEE